MKNVRYGWLVGAIFTVMLLGGCQAVGLQADESELLMASGTIQADEVRVASELGGRIVRLSVEAGQTVSVGDELVVLDAASLLSKLAEAEAAIVAAQADLEVVRAGPQAAEIAAMQASLALAGAQHDGALAAWENAIVAVESPQELDAQIADARTQVELAAQNVELAEAQLARERLLRDQRPEGSMERQVFDLQVQAAEEALAAAQAEERAAQILLDRLWVIRRQPLALLAQAHSAEGQHRISEAAVVVAQARLDDLLAGPAQHEIAVAEANLNLAQAQADVLRAQLAKFTLTSPVSGVVLDRLLYGGEVAAPAATILTLADLGAVTLMVYVPENRIGQVTLGQAVQVTVDSFPGRTFEGRVARIGSEPEFTPRNVATQEERLNTFYAVEVQLPNPEGLLKPGMPADATF
ncbi:MAG: HlyD family secretion protein [Chloroflexota bacterium]